MNGVESLLKLARDVAAHFEGTDAPLGAQARDALAACAPYREFCRHPEKCAGLGSCPRDPCCCD
jgi:hypothetical protein